MMEFPMQNYNHNMFSIMDYYIGSGRFLNDKDRNNNDDSREIQEFFKPIDKIFGDYETRKKFNLSEQLFRKNQKDAPTIIELGDLGKRRGELITFTVLSVDNELRINVNWIKPDKIDETVSEIRRAIVDANQDFPVLEFYILDPVKLHQIVELDEARHLTFKNALLDSLGIKISEATKDLHYRLIDKLVDYRLEQRKQRQGEIRKSTLETLTPLGLPDFRSIVQELNIDSEDKEKLDSAKLIYFAFRFNKVKIKNFERIEDIRLRLGRYDDGRYVIFLHPYKSETHCPGRIPSE